MFKAKIIDEKNYSAFRSKQLLLIFILSIPLGFFISIPTFSIWFKFAFTIGYLYIAFLLFRNAKSIRSTPNHKLVEINEDKIRIMDKHNKEIELYDIGKITEITVMEKFRLPQENLKDIIDEVFGKYKINFIKFVYQDKTVRINFEIDSNYMLKKLNEVVDKWVNSGMKLNKIK